MQPARFRQADFSLVKINNAKSTSPDVSSGEERGLLSRTAAGNQPITWLAFKNISREPTLLEKDQHLCMRDEPIRHALVPSFCSLRMDAWEHDLPFGKKNGCIF